MMTRSAPRAIAAMLAVAGAVAEVAQADEPYPHGAVAADHVLASRAGVEMLERGGNAVDAAVAASFCLSVVRPYSCGIGGGGFMVIAAPADRDRPAVLAAIDYRETAPAAVGPDYYVELGVDGASRTGAHAVGVPGTVAGLLRALDRHGTLDRATVLAPAIRVATEGWPADASHRKAVATLAARRLEHPELARQSDHLWDPMCRAGDVEPGTILTNPQQAAALELIARHGAAAYYRGPIGEALVRAVRRGGGTITMADLAGYRVRSMAPLHGRVRIGGRDLDVYTMPPPSSGGIAQLQVVGILGRLDAGGVAGPRDAAYVHVLVEAFKHAFADRAAHVADPDFAEVPVSGLLDPAYLDRVAASIDTGRTREPSFYGSVAPGAVDGGTSHLSVVDARGMAVACTETINLEYGSTVPVPEYGFVLNDEMDDFTTDPGRPNAFGLRQSEANAPEPGKRPLSSMSPTIVLENGRPILVAGASGGPRIITATLQCMLNVLAFDLGAAEAVALPRVHHQWLPDVLMLEPAWRAEGDFEALEALGHATADLDEIGVVQLLKVTPSGIHAASDPRKGGRAHGY